MLRLGVMAKKFFYCELHFKLSLLFFRFIACQLSTNFFISHQKKKICQTITIKITTNDQEETIINQLHFMLNHQIKELVLVHD